MEKHHGKHHDFGNVDEWVERFDNPKRDEWQKPEAVIALLQLSGEETIADLGAGTGYFVVRLAPKTKRVIGIDIEPKMVEHLVMRAKDAGFDNVEGVVASPDDAKLPDGVDIVLVVNTYHHIDDRVAYFGRVREALNPGGRVAIVDFKPGESEIGPPAAMRLSREAVAEELTAAGFKMQLVDEETLPEQYVVVAARE